jgi:hypothetical protein
MNLGVPIGIAFIILWAFLFPLAIIVFLYRHRKSLSEIHILKVYGLFYVGLTDENFFWEILIVNLRKVIFILIATVI